MGLRRRKTPEFPPTSTALGIHIAAVLNLPYRVVFSVLNLFLLLIVRTLTKHGQLVLNHVGTLVVQSTQKNTIRTVRVAFYPSQQLLRRLAQTQRDWRPAMEKYGVDEVALADDEKRASAEKCPRCGSDTEKHGRVTICPLCGSQPFEEKDEHGKK